MSALRAGCPTERFKLDLKTFEKLKLSGLLKNSGCGAVW